MKRCQNCGTKLDGYTCPNCEEETIILQQYMDQEMDPPSQEFLDKVKEQSYQIKDRKRLMKD